MINYQEKSWTKDIEDKLIDEFIIKSNNIDIIVKKYSLSDETTRWLLQFEKDNIYYWIHAMCSEKEIIYNVVESLYLP